MTDRVFRALDPGASVVVQSCAGSGKTWLLVSRIVRLLLLERTRPEEILAITFTRKARQEMVERLHTWLRWMALAEEEPLLRFLMERGLSRRAAQAALPRARALFELCTGAGGGPQITTFHGWFGQLVRQAPLDSGVDGTFDLAENTGPLVEEAWRRLARDAAMEGSALAGAMQALAGQCTPARLRGLLEAALARRGEWWAWSEGRSDPAGDAAQQLEQQLGVTLSVDPGQALLADPDVVARLEETAALLAGNTAQDRQLAARLRAALALGAAAGFDSIYAVFCTQAHTVRSRKESAEQRRRLGEAGEARLLALHASLAGCLLAARRDRLRQQAVRLNRDGLRCAAALIAHYQQIKAERRLMDFTDLEWLASRLLSAADDALFMLHRLDSRCRHVLVDEFQDTNPLQWRALRAWLDAAAEADLRPSVFLVGDPKQSIYRFRGAESGLFDLAADYLVRHYGAWRLSQDVSWRCAPAVLDAVNRVFGGDDPLPGFAPHTARHPGQWGRVEAWPPVGAEDGEAADNLPPHLTEEARRRYQEGLRVAARIRDMTAGWQLPTEAGGRRALQYGDILLLVRARTHLIIYEEALRRSGVPFVSCREGGLLDTLEVGDLVALLRFLCLPCDDLSLAQALRSPLFGLSDADLAHLAAQPQPLWWERLRALALAPPFAAIAARLEAWMRFAHQQPVHQLLDRIFNEADVPACYRRAAPPLLGEAVEQNLMAFLELALSVDEGRYPGLARFLDALAALRRSPGNESPAAGQAMAPDAVRILTIHGAKGLEAPVVWLLDGHTDTPDEAAGVVVDWPPDAPAPLAFHLSGGAALREVAAPGQGGAAREARNLLYVAMTRARHMFAISGAGGRRGGLTPVTVIRAALGEAREQELLVAGEPPLLD